MEGTSKANDMDVIVFEDHNWLGLRPLCASQPVFELRCGMFNTRERLELAGAGDGILLCRAHLAPLVQAGSWRTNVAPPAGRRSLWLSARLGPSCDLVRALLALGAGGDDFSCWDDGGLVAAALDGRSALAAFADWQSWQAGRAATFTPGLPHVEAGGASRGLHLRLPAGADGAQAGLIGARLAEAAGDAGATLGRAWDLVPATAAALASDLAAGLAAGGWERRPFGLVPDGAAPAGWGGGRTVLARHGAADLPAGAWLQGDAFWCARDVAFAPGAVIDTRKGPVVVDQGCDIGPHTLLEGPLYLGPGCRVKAGARLYGESSFGVGNRLAGEIGESTFGDFTNKQHEGFIGHAVLGSWVNLGALTTCSDLKNNYGSVKVDLGDGLQETGRRFVGLLAGDHVKTAIGTLFNTGTSVGFASNIFGEGMPPKYVPAFSWGGRAGDPAYGLEAAVATAGIVLGRRGCRFLPAHAELFAHLAAR